MWLLSSQCAMDRGSLLSPMSACEALLHGRAPRSSHFSLGAQNSFPSILFNLNIYVYCNRGAFTFSFPLVPQLQIQISAKFFHLRLNVMKWMVISHLNLFFYYGMYNNHVCIYISFVSPLIITIIRKKNWHNS